MPRISTAHFIPKGSSVHFAVAFFLCIFAFSVNASAASSWVLVWSDEFDKPGLPDSSKWGYDEGGSGWGNHELEYYTKARIENASVANGVLSINARKESYNGKQYTSARLVTAGKGDWLYGKFQVRAKLPRGLGMWSAIWLLPTDWTYGDWPASGELDIMEDVGYDSTRINSNIHSSGTNQGNSVTIADPWNTWHVYGLEWYPDSMSYWVDDTHIFTFFNAHKGSSTWPFDKRFHFILNLAIGGDWGGIKGVDDSRFPQSMQVDYVRVYQSDTSSNTKATPPPAGELVWNGDFSQNALKWNSVGSYQGAQAMESIDNGECHINVTTPGTLDWHVQLSQGGLRFEEGKTYHVSFRARASVARSIAIAGNQDIDPWATYGKDTVQISTSMQDYSFNFTMNKPTDTSARIEFDLGGTASEIWIDDVSVQEFKQPTDIARSTRIYNKSLSAWAKRRAFDLLGRNLGGQL